ncbi:hypothetical protein, partial [Streptomyces sp. NPDC052701]|uniref:hypothetical protein n=1 Tax=Streptomyces sp. NPDC052701 TaxID=3155533 RepID=UPI003446A590
MPSGFPWPRVARCRGFRLRAPVRRSAGPWCRSRPCGPPRGPGAGRGGVVGPGAGAGLTAYGPADPLAGQGPHRAGRAAESFYNAFFLDHDEGAVYFNTLANGLP